MPPRSIACASTISIDAIFAPVLALAHALDRADRWVRRTLSFEEP
jgi:hypothetical protein